MEAKKILVVGSSNTDLIIKVKDIPRPGETLLGGEFNTFPGGKGANQAVAAARAGGEVVFIAAVGDDSYGAESVQGYQSDGINTENIKVCRGIPSGVALITIADSGENAIAVASGANALLRPDDLEEVEEAFDEAEVMLIQLETPLDTVQKAVEMAREMGTSVILNPAPAAELPEAILRNVDILTPNETEAETLTGITVKDKNDAVRAAAALHHKGIGTVIITLGADGAFVSDEESGLSTIIGGFKVNAEDTTAAGDTFNGQLAVALAEGMELEKAVLSAHAAAALSVQRLGAQASVPHRQETETFLSTH